MPIEQEPNKVLAFTGGSWYCIITCDVLLQNGVAIGQKIETLVQRVKQLERKLENEDKRHNQAKLEENSLCSVDSHMRERLEKAQERISQLLQEKSKLETALQYEKHELDIAQNEIHSLKNLTQEKEKYLKEVIAFREQQVSECEEKLRTVEKELESEKQNVTYLEEMLQQTREQLAEKSAEAKVLHEWKVETSSQLTQERKRMDKLVMQKAAGTSETNGKVIQVTNL